MINKIFSWLDDYFSRDERAKILELESKLKEKDEEIEALRGTIRIMAEEKINLVGKIKKLTQKDPVEEYWNNKHKKADIRYTGRYIPRYGMVDIDVRAFINPYNAWIPRVRGKTTDEIMLNALKWVRRNITYVSDKNNEGIPEYWQFPFETIRLRKGDCIAEYEEIYTKEGVKKVGELEVGDLVLSYDFNKREFVYKPIIKIWEKGKLPVKRVHLRNGQHVDITDNHPLWVRTSRKDIKYEKVYLKDIDLTKWWKRKLPIAKKIPYEVRDIEWLDEELCLVLGHFLAEGWVGNGKVCSSGYELTEEIIPILERHNIPFTEYKNNSGVPCIRFLKSDFKEFLKKQKTDSFDIHIQEEIFHLPENKLEAILRGFWIGDGHNGNYPDKRGYNSNKQEVYSTSSEQLARDIQRIGLQIGKTFHIWKQENHGGIGNKPIYRITYNPESHFLKDYGYKDISEVSISFIEDLGEAQMRDFEVKDTHTFVFKNGLISHQCEDGAILMYNIALRSGVPYWRMRLNAGDVKGGGHCYLTYCREKDNNFVVMDWCYWPNDKHPSDRPLHKDEKNYYGVWFSWNQKYAFYKAAKDLYEAKKSIPVSKKR